jgi:hypothetical protein
MVRSFGRFTLPLIPLLLGCSSSAEARQCPVSPESPEAAPSASAPSVVVAGTQPEGSKTEAAAVAPAPTSSDAPAPSDAPAAASATAAEPQSLPELTLKITGMHIGGGPNDSETKRPFMNAIESGFGAMQDCYRKSDEPTKGGTYGVDLRVERDGGHPTVQGVRTAMKGDALTSCLEKSFQNLTFGKPAKGATVLSVSVKFSLGE